jgi:hypothetical protein
MLSIPRWMPDDAPVEIDVDTPVEIDVETPEGLLVLAVSVGSMDGEVGGGDSVILMSIVSCSGLGRLYQSPPVL